MHPHAEAAAETAECAGAHGKFWEMHDLLNENQEHLSGHLFLGLAEELELAATALRQALEAGEFKTRVRSDFTGGIRSGVNGTPTFFINGRRHDGPFDLESLVTAIDAAMSAAKGSAEA
jgi:protein-disulfide isomerase